MKRIYIIGVIAVAAILVVAAVLLSGVVSPGKTIRYTDVPPAQQQAFMQNGQIDGGVSWEPYCSDSIVAGTGHALIWSDEIWPNHPCCVVAADEDFIASDEDAVRGVLKAHVEATKWINDAIANKDSDPANYSLLLEIGAQFSDRSEDVVEAALEHMTLTYNVTDETKGYLEQFTQAYINSSLIASGKISNVEQFINDYVDTSYVDATIDMEPVAEDAPLTTVRMAYLQGDIHQFARVVAESPQVGELLGLGSRSLFNAYGVQTQNPEGMPSAGYPNGGAVMTSFQGGYADMGYLGAPPAILFHANQNVDTKIVALANTEGSALIVSNSIESIDDLDGKLIGEPGSSSIQYLLLLAIAEKYGFDVERA
jgi:NitT/TauT family transport system substrate-binding protein